MQRQLKKYAMFSIIATFLFLVSVPHTKAESGLADVEPVVPLLASEIVALDALYKTRGSTQGTYIEQEKGHITLLEIYNTEYVEEWVFPAEIANLTALREVEIDATKLSQPLPAALFENPTLKSLSLKNYTLPLPEVAFEKSGLENMSFYSCTFAALPEKLGKMPQLNSLYVYKGVFSALPESLGNLQKLEYIDIRDSLLQSLPKSLGNLKSLKSLRVYNSKLTALPESFGLLPALEEAFFWGNSIAALPLDMAGNKILKSWTWVLTTLGRVNCPGCPAWQACQPLNLLICTTMGFQGKYPPSFFPCRSFCI